MRRNMLWGLAALVSVSLVGCKSDHLILATHTKLGVDITVDGKTPTNAVFGYKRFEGAVVPVDRTVESTAQSEPQSEPKSEGDPKGNASDSGSANMESVFGALDVRNGWLNGIGIHQMLATGDAADELAKRPERARELLASLKKKKVADGSESGEDE